MKTTAPAPKTMSPLKKRWLLIFRICKYVFFIGLFIYWIITWGFLQAFVSYLFGTVCWRALVLAGKYHRMGAGPAISNPFDILRGNY